MQFKKHFSTNLQNLSVKKTVVMDPPPQLPHDLSLSSQLLSSRKANSPFTNHRQCSSAIGELQPQNKENRFCNSPTPEQLSESRPSSQGKFRERPQNGSSMLTFQAIKEGLMERQQINNKRIFVPFKQTCDSCSQQQQILLLKQSSSIANFNAVKRQPKISNNVRLGSMVFSSLSKPAGSDKANSQWARESRSHEKKAKQQLIEIQCMNNDGRPAKYKVVKVDYGEKEEMLHYCFNCAIPLVKQGFTVQELNQIDRRQLSTQKNSSYQGHGLDGPQKSCFLTGRKQNEEEKVKLGQQIKSKIILRINKVKACREQFQNFIAQNTQKIDFYFDSIVTFIEQQRLESHKELLRLKNMKKTEPQKYEQQLNCALGTIDYLVRHPQGLTDSSVEEIERLLQKDVTYPQMKSYLLQNQDLQYQLHTFSGYFKQNLSITCQPNFNKDFEHNRRYTHGGQLSCGSRSQDSAEYKGNPFRFSFQSALRESKINNPRKTINTCYQMNPLVEQSESELEDSIQAPRQRKDAFRNLFPEEGQELNFGDDEEVVQSPIFKQF